MPKMEIRDNSLVVDGYVNAVCRDSKPIFDLYLDNFFIEQIKEGTFAESLGRNPDVKMLFNHNDERELAKNGVNMQLHEDAIGLRVHAEIQDAEVVQAAKNGDIQGWSFGFMNPISDWQEDKPYMRRFIKKLDLVEVSILTVEPAYYATTAEFRSNDKAMQIRSINEKFEIDEQASSAEETRSDDVEQNEVEGVSTLDYSALLKKIDLIEKEII